MRDVSGRLVVDAIEDAVVEGAIVEVGATVLVGLESDDVGVLVGLVLGDVVGGLVVPGSVISIVVVVSDGLVVGDVVVGWLVVGTVEGAIVEDGFVVGVILEVGGNVVVIISLVEVSTVGLETDNVCVFNVDDDDMVVSAVPEVGSTVVSDTASVVIVDGKVLSDVLEPVVASGIVVGAVVEVGGNVVVIISLVEETSVELESDTVCVFNVVIIDDNVVSDVPVVGSTVVSDTAGVVIVDEKAVSDVIEPVELGGNVMTDSVVEGFTDSVIDSVVEETDVEVIDTVASDTTDVIVDEKEVSDITLVISVIPIVVVSGFVEKVVAWDGISVNMLVLSVISSVLVSVFVNTSEVVELIPDVEAANDNKKGIFTLKKIVAIFKNTLSVGLFGQ